MMQTELPCFCGQWRSVVNEGDYCESGAGSFPAKREALSIIFCEDCGGSKVVLSAGRGLQTGTRSFRLKT